MIWGVVDVCIKAPSLVNPPHGRCGHSQCQTGLQDVTVIGLLLYIRMPCALSSIEMVRN